MENLKKLSRGILASLILQFVLGMVTNLFTAPPDDPKYLTESPFFKIIFIIHGINGLVLPVFSLVILFFAFKSKGSELKTQSIWGFISILVAAVAGISTIMLKETQSEVASLVMSVGFIASLIFYGKLYFLAKENRE